MGGTHVDLPLALGPAFAVMGLAVLVLALATYDAYLSYEGAEGGGDAAGGGADE